MNDIIKQFSKKYNSPKNKTIATSKRFPKDYKTAKKISECFTQVWTEHYEQVKTKEKKSSKFGFTCKNKFCDVCNMLKGNKYKFALHEKIDELRKTKKQRFLFLTLTVENRPLDELSDTLKEMNEAWFRLWRNSLQYRMNGFFKVVEFTIDKDKKMHPHFHILLSVDNSYFDNWFNTNEIAEKWQQALKVNYTPIVDIRAIKGNKRQLEKSIKELVKYTMKHSDFSKLNENEMVMLDEQLKGKRFIATGGIMKMSLRQIEKDLLENSEDFENTELWKKIGTIIYNYLYSKSYIPVKIEFENKQLETELKKEANEIIKLHKNE